MNLLGHCTKAVRAADEQFEREGGSSRHWVRDCFLPALEAEGLCVRPATDREAVGMGNVERWTITLCPDCRAGEHASAGIYCPHELWSEDQYEQVAVVPASQPQGAVELSVTERGYINSAIAFLREEGAEAEADVIERLARAAVGGQ